MKIIIAYQLKLSFAVYDVMRQADWQSNPINISTPYGIYSFLRCSLFQSNIIETMRIRKCRYVIGNIH